MHELNIQALCLSVQKTAYWRNKLNIEQQAYVSLPICQIGVNAMTQRVIDIKVACLAILGVLRATAFAQLCEDSCSFFVTYKGEPRCRSPPLSEFEQATQI